MANLVGQDEGDEMSSTPDKSVPKTSSPAPSRAKLLVPLLVVAFATVCCVVVVIAASLGESPQQGVSSPSATEPPAPALTDTPPSRAPSSAEPIGPSTSPLTPTTPDDIIVDEHGISLGTLADDILALRGQTSEDPLVLGSDSNGLIVQWLYPDYAYTLRRSEIEGVTAYRVSEIERRH